MKSQIDFMFRSLMMIVFIIFILWIGHHFNVVEVGECLVS